MAIAFRGAILPASDSGSVVLEGPELKRSQEEP